MKKKRNDGDSPIFSILNEFKCPNSDVYVFEDLGKAAMGSRHIVVFFRQPKSETLVVGKEGRLAISNSLLLLEIRSEQLDMLFGYLFIARDSANISVTDKTLFYRTTSELGNFALVPCLNDKNGVFVYKDNLGNILANISVADSLPFLVLDS